MKPRFALPTLMFSASLAGLNLHAVAEPDVKLKPSTPGDPAEAAADNLEGFLGVAVAESPAPPGVGPEVPRTVLVVSEVMPDSAADAAGLRSGDVLLTIDGQHLLHPVQLRRLVSMNPAGRAVELTIIRDGQAQTLPATLGVRPTGLAEQPTAARQPGAMPPFGEFQQIPLEPQPLDLQGDLQQMRERMDRQFEQMRQMFREGMNEGWPGGDMWERMDLVELDFDFGAMPGGQNVTVFQDHHHKITVTQNKDGRHLRATDLEDHVLFDGPIDTPEQLNAVPQELRDKLPEPGDINFRVFPKLDPADFFERLNPRLVPPADNEEPGEQLPAPAGRAV